MSYLDSKGKPAAMSSPHRFRLWLVWVALFCVLSRAIGATFYDSEYLIDSWQTEQGLPESTANAVVQTADGYLWIATFNGLVRFDGMRFTVFDRLNTPELPSDGIVNLHLDQSGWLWLSTLKGIAVRKDNKWSVLKKSPVSQSNFIRTFSEAAGVLCATTFDGKVYRIQDGHAVELPAPPGLVGQGYLGHVEPTGTIWVGQVNFFGFLGWPTLDCIPAGARGHQLFQRHGNRTRWQPADRERQYTFADQCRASHR
jgi:hypothetical protein